MCGTGTCAVLCVCQGRECFRDNGIVMEIILYIKKKYVPIINFKIRIRHGEQLTFWITLKKDPVEAGS